MEAVAKTAVKIFEHIIRYQGVPELVPFLLQLPQKDVVPVRQRTLALQREWEQALGGHWHRRDPANLMLLFFLTGLVVYTRKEAVPRNLDALGTARLSNWDWEEPSWARGVAVVLDHARPAWLTDWLLRVTRVNPGWALDFGSLQNLVSRGLVEPEPWLLAQSVATQLVAYSNKVTLAQRLAHCATTGKWDEPEQAEMWDRLRQQRPALAAAAARPWAELLLAELQADSALLKQGVPLLFEYDTLVDSPSATRGIERSSWLELLPQLAASGHLERGELLTRSLLALRRDFRRALLLWFKDLFLALQPTAAERLARQTELTELLAHPLPLVVNFAVEQLKELWGLPGLRAAPLLQFAEALMGRADLKTSLKALLSGFGSLLKAQPEQAPALARLYVAALAQPDTDLQTRAAKAVAELLGTSKPALPALAAHETVAALGQIADLLVPAARAVLAPWLSATADAPAAETAAYAPRPDFVPDLSEATAIAPVADWHELLFLTGAVLKRGEPAAHERWLDGLLRLHEQLPADHVGQLRPYLTRLLPELKVASETERAALLAEPLSISGHESLTHALLLSWATGFVTAHVRNVQTEWADVADTPLLALEQRRYQWAETLLATPTALPLLSTPTHQPFWLAPTALVARLLAYQAAGVAPNTADLAVALARTAHAHAADSAAARTQLPQLREVGLRALLTWFLGAAELPLLASSTDAAPRKPAGLDAPLAAALPELWAVAARTKDPNGVFPGLTAWLGYDVRGLTQPSKSAFEVKHQGGIAQNQPQPGQPLTYRWTELRWRFPLTNAAPSPLLYSWKDSWYRVSDFDFVAALVPGFPSPLYDYTVQAHTDKMMITEHDLMERALRSLLGAGPVYAPAAQALLACGLLHPTPQCRSLAQEVLAQAVAHGRLEPVGLGEFLGLQLATEYAPVQRLADALTQTRGLDPRTDDALRQLLEALLPALPNAAPPRNTRLLLDAYAAVRARAPHPVPAPVQAQLRAWSAVSSLKAVLKGLLS